MIAKKLSEAKAYEAPNHRACSTLRDSPLAQELRETIRDPLARRPHTSVRGGSESRLRPATPGAARASGN